MPLTQLLNISERLSEFIERTEVTGFKYFPDRKGHLLSLASTDKRCMMQIPAAMCAHYNDHPSEVTVAKLRSAGRDWFVFFSSRLGRLVALEVLPFLMPCARTDVRTKAS